MKKTAAKKTVKTKPRTDKKIKPSKEPGESIESLKAEAVQKERFLENVGRRKTSLARVRLFPNGSGKIIINGKDLKDYFSSFALQGIVRSPIKKVKIENFDITVKTRGGGIHSQAEAIRHGIARALLMVNPIFRKRLKRASFLKRDSRMKERRKFGLKKARKAPQWSKR